MKLRYRKVGYTWAILAISSLVITGLDFCSMGQKSTFPLESKRFPKYSACLSFATALILSSYFFAIVVGDTWAILAISFLVTDEIIGVVPRDLPDFLSHLIINEVCSSDESDTSFTQLV